MTRLRFALAILVLSSCQEREVSVGGLQEVMILPAIPNPNVDILFVIDSSPSMTAKQESLAASFPLMMDRLAMLDGGLPNVHIGVVTTDMGTSATNGMWGPGIGAGPGSCATNGEDGVLRHDLPELGGAYFLSDIRNPDGTRTRNYTGELRDVFASLARVGASGCGFEQPLHAMRRALENPVNAGFLRSEANLAVVIIADEDDCSIADPYLLGADTMRLGPLQSFRCTHFGVTCETGGETPDDMNTPGPKSDCHASTDSTMVSDVSPFGDFLVDLKGDPNAVMVAVIAGAPPVQVEMATPPGGGTAIPALAHSCTYAYGSTPETADPAVRLAEFVAGFPARGALTSICSADLSAPLTTIGTSTSRMMGDACIGTSLVDASAEAGVQPTCEVLEGPLGAETAIPPCAANQTGTCWSLVLDTAKCAGIADNLRLQITRPSAPTSQLYSHLRCLTR